MLIHVLILNVLTFLYVKFIKLSRVNVFLTKPGTLPEEQPAGAAAIWCVQQHAQAFPAWAQWKSPEDSGWEHVQPYARLVGLNFFPLNQNALIKVVSRAPFCFTSELNKLYLHDNPWHCDCNLISLVRWIGQTKATMSPRSTLKCVSPPELKNKSLGSLQPGKLQCST